MCEFLKSPETDADALEIQRLQNRVAAEAFVSGCLFEILTKSQSDPEKLVVGATLWQMLLDARKTNDYEAVLKYDYSTNLA